MPAIGDGQVAEVYFPVLGAVNVRPGPNGRVSINSRSRKGGPAIAPREVYSSETFRISAGDVVLLEAIGAEAFYSSSSAGQNISAITYDGSSRVTGYVKDGVSHVVTYPSATQIIDSSAVETVTITLDGAGRPTDVVVV